MKLSKISMALSFAAIILASCVQEEKSLFENKVYINVGAEAQKVPFTKSNSPVNEVRELTIGTPAPAANDVTGRFEFDFSLVENYNEIYGAEAIALPEEAAEIANPDVILDKGSVKSTVATVTFSNTQDLNFNNLYVAPVVLTNVVGMDVLESKSVVYYVFKGEALINVVADIQENYFPVRWSDKCDVSALKTITCEALIRVKSFSVGGPKKEALSTIFGVEGEWLLRVGDVDRGNDELQLSTSRGSFPQGRKVSGIPTNEWVHIAVVWDGETGDRIYYRNGTEMIRDTRAGGTFDLTEECYIGRSCNLDRWLYGEISELRVWTVARNQKEISDNIYKVDPKTPGLLAYWKFNEGTGNVISDRTGNGNNVESAEELVWNKVTLPEEEAEETPEE